VSVVGLGERLVGAVLPTTPGRTAALAISRAWLRSGCVPGHALPVSVALAGFFADRGFRHDARALLVTAEEVHPDLAVRAGVQAARARLQVDDGELPDDLSEVLTSLLSQADSAWEAKDVESCARRLSEALTLGFHGNLQFGPHTLVISDPDPFLSLFRRSTAFSALSEPSGRRPPPVRNGLARRVLFVSFRNWNFVRGIIEDYRDAGVEVRMLDLSERTDVRTDLTTLIRAKLHLARTGEGIAPPADIAAMWRWADTVFVEWANRQAVWASLLDVEHPRLVVRLHSYEASIAAPHVTDWSVVSNLVFVSGTVRELTGTVIPAVGAAAHTHTVPNRNELETFVRAKCPGAERTLAMVGWATENKDPAWALDVLEALQDVDEQWRLILVGHAPDGAAVATPYFSAVLDRIARLGSAVETVGFTRDVAGVLTRAGVILSASRREGTHEGFIEGVASGAFPVARNWPAVARWGGPGQLFPRDWIVDGPEEAARRILNWAEAADRDKEVAATQQWVLERYSWPHVRQRLDAVVLGEAGGGEAT
jgi:glycosyltransferase involved in cell wall biosynthesis